MLTAADLKLIFEKAYNRSDWYNVLKNNFNVTTLKAKPADITSSLTSNDYNAKAFELGEITTQDGHLVGMYEVEVPVKAQIHSNRKGLRNLLAQVYRNDVEAALVVFIQGSKWRFTYVSEITVKNKTTGKRERKTTDPKRFTYLLGEGERCKTAADRFERIQKTEDLFGKGITLTALEEAFNVEKMSKAFFNEYRKQYGQFTAHITGEDENGKEVQKAAPFLQAVFNGNHKEARDFVKKMLGRIVFLYFLEKKGWLGVPANGKWEDGDENFLSNLYQHCKHKKLFYSNVLVPLFFETLNTDRTDDFFKVDDTLFTKPGYSKLKIPYLNGGLFEEDDIATQTLVFPEELFANLFAFFDQYNFTVYEDSPDEHTVAVDPEMLGHIFENLLEDNKDKGAFYTPKEIVHYMCRESLIEYLYTKLNPTDNNVESLSRAALENFVLHHEAADIIEQDAAILTALKEVKICDPAIGSGAFPMGLLMEIFYLVETLYHASPDVTAQVWKLGNQWNPAAVKESIIQNSIYGVDIEKGAVDIARLRFWLSLVVDEQKPKALPNLDYKIVVGNSLLSKFNNEVIEIDWNTNAAKATEATQKLIADQAANLNTLQSWQAAYFSQKGNKQKQQIDIRDKKIDILITQLTLSRISYQQNNPILGGFAPTPKEIQKNVENELVLAGFDQTIQKLQAVKSNKTASLDFFDWKLNFPEVMNERVVKGEAGFDIVIGNPPYVRRTAIEESDKLSLERIYVSAYKQYDLYILFMEIGLKIIKMQGKLTYINPVKFFTTDSGFYIRKILLENCSINTIIDISQISVFENALTYTGVFIITKDRLYNNEIKYTKLYNLNFTEIQFSSFAQHKFLEDRQKFLIFEDQTKIKIINKIEIKSHRLGEYFKTSRGIPNSKIEFNPKFNINAIKSVSVKKYLIDSSRLKIDIDKAIKQKYDKVFQDELVILPRTVKTIQASLKPPFDYLLDRIYFLIPKVTKTGVTNKNLLGQLNSKLINFWFDYRYSSSKVQGGYFDLSGSQIDEIPLLINNNFGISSIVNEILINKQKGANTMVLESQIDLMMYKLYELSYEEACIVEGNSDWMSKEAYEGYNLEG